MGCDIHAYIEYEYRSTQWSGFGGKINPGRNYEIFGRLAGVRDDEQPHISPRGLPENRGWKSKDDNLLYITKDENVNDGEVSEEQARNWIERGISKMDGEHWVTHPDWHSHSWLSYKELSSILEDFKNEPEYQAILACMKSFEEQGYKSRLVFWFDN